MDPRKRGDMNEKRLEQALNEIHADEPEFVQDHRAAPPAMDARGIDRLVKMGLPKRSRKTAMTVPVEVKSSPTGVAKWRVVHSDLHRAGVLIFWIPDKFSPRRLRRLVYRALKKVQQNSRDGTLYHGMFQRLFKGRGSKNLQKNIDRIKEKRASERKPPRKK